MTEIERQVAAFLRDEADRGGRSARIYERVLRGATIRRVATATVAGMAVIAVVMASVVTASALRSPSTIGPAGPGEASPTESSPPGTATDEDKRLIRALIRFARSPDPETIAGVPFAEDGVWLGLADRLLTRRTTQQLVEPEAWALQVGLFRAASGPFSALDHLAGFKKTTVSVGPHPHCVSPAVPPPKKVADLRRVSVQPTDYQSCLQWSTVDVFVTPDDEVLAVTLDLWEP